MAWPVGSEPPPARRGGGWSDEAVESVLGHLLRAGVMLAAAIVLVGGIRYLAHYGAGAPPGRIFTGEPTDLKQIAGILRGAAALRGRAIIMCGLLVLIATPIARVGASLIAFAQQRDHTYVGLTALVLAVLAAGLMGWSL